MKGFRPLPGTEFTLDGKWYQVSTYDTARGCLVLVDSDGVLTTMALDDLVHHPRLVIDGQKKAPLDLVRLLPEAERDLVLRRIEHVNEAVTGYRSGDPERSLPAEPQPHYDPRTTFKKDRFAAKEAELDNEFARRCGEYMSVSTMRRIESHLREGIAFQGAVDGRKRRRSGGRRAVPPEVAEATVRLVESRRDKSTMSVAGLFREVRGRMIERHGKAWTRENFPSERTWRRFVADRWTKSELTGKARTRATATNAPEGGFHRTNPTRPGELVLMDTNSLDVLLKGTSIEGAVNGSLVAGLDAFSWSVCSVRVVEQAEKDLDIGFALLDLSRPKQMLPGWPEEARWPFVGLPEQLIMTSSGYTDHEAEPGLAGMPFVNPEALSLDHGTPYKSHKTRELATRYGIDLLPARVRTGSDKAGIERFFGALRSMLLEHLDGYRGTDTSERGANVDNEVEWTAQALEDLISKWVVMVWQTHILEDVKPPWCPEGDWSPNALYQHGITTSGLVPRLMTADDYYGVLSTSFVKVHSRGVKIKGLWYDNDPDASDPVLDSRRNKPAPNATKKWTVQYDRRDLRRVFFVDENGERHTLRWVGASGQFPCFSERHVQALRRRVKANLHLIDDITLAEILLTEILPQRDTDGWTANGKKANKAASKTARDAELATSDAAKYGVDHDATAAPPAVGALEEKRKQRRETATGDDVPPAPRLGSTRTSIFGNLAVNDEDES